MDRGKRGLKRSVVTDGGGIPLHVVSAGANRHDAPLLGPTLAGLDKLGGRPEKVTVHLDRGYDGAPARALPTYGRPVAEIIADLRKPLHPSLVKTRTQGGNSIAYIEWHTACRLLDSFAPGWEGKVVDVKWTEGAVLVTYAVTIHAAEGSFTREATGNELFDSKGYGDPFSNAEAMAFKRAAAKWGVGVHLYEKG